MFVKTMFWNVNVCASLSCVVDPCGFINNVGFVGSSTTSLFGIKSLQYADLRNNFNPAVLFDELFFLFIASSCVGFL